MTDNANRPIPPGTKLLNYFPSSDLVNQLLDIESGLNQRRRLGRVGLYGGLVLWLLQLVALAPEAPGPAEYIWIPAAALTGIYLWSAFWLKVSRQAFRYTCSVGQFRVATGAESDGPCCLVEPKMGWIPYDLAQRLNQRVQRLFFSEIGEAKSGAELVGEPGLNERHIHIDGSYLIRPRKEEESTAVTLEEDLLQHCAWEIVVMPRVSMGPTSQHGRLGYMVTYPIDQCRKDGCPPGLTRQDYEQLAERVYHSVATEIYHQIEVDVHEKIDLLPTSYHRAVALFHEAEDYARSNTLQAYQVARRLYREAAVALYPFDPLLTRVPHSLPRRAFRKCRSWLYAFVRAIRRRLGWIPRIANREVLLARARIGYANMVLFEHRLAHLSGRADVPAYRARPVAKKALADLEKLHEDVDERDDALFDAHVSLGYGHACLADYRKAKEVLDGAKRLNPSKTTTSATYLLASSRALRYSRNTEKDVQKEVCEAKLDRLIPATEISPRLEVAAFKKAFAAEMLWRAGDSPLESTKESEMVLAAYEDVLTLNPGNIGAAANAGYVAWLCGKTGKAERYFRRARDYKLMMPQTVIVELNYGLARIYAEAGRFEDAYKYFQLARKGVMAHESTHQLTNKDYFHIAIDSDVLKRYEDYKETVFFKADALDHERCDRPSNVPPCRTVVDAVRAFVANDCAEAQASFYERNKASRLEEGQEKRKDAISLFKESSKLYGTYEAPLLNLARLSIDDNRETSKGCYETLSRIASHSRHVALARAQYLGNVVEHDLEADEATSSKAATERLKKHVQRAQEEAAKLLPHEWLWKEGQELKKHDFDSFRWSILDQKRFRQEAKWERDFDKVHVDALRAWIAPERTVMDNSPDRWWRDEESKESVEKLSNLINEVFGEAEVSKTPEVRA